MTTTTRIIIVLLVIGLAFGVLLAFLWKEKRDNGYPSNGFFIGDFQECQVRGFPVLETYPAQCRTGDGRVFTEDIGNEIELRDRIQIDRPRPNTSISSPLTISGRARGSWFFEAESPVRLTDADGNILATGSAKAQGEWMTDEFVPFTATITFSPGSQRNGTLFLVKANPSGLPENDAALEVPVRF